MLTVRVKAFTLIELLLVIAVLAIITAVGIMTYRQSFQTNRIDTVSLEMQHVLEAAMAFYVDTGAWPTAQPCDGSVVANNFINDYLPNASTQSHFGTDFCWGTLGSTNRLFWVAVQVPGSATDTTLATATRLAGRLPNAVTTSAPDQSVIPPEACTDSLCYVRAEITVPGASTNATSGLSLAATGNCQTGQNNIANTGGGVCNDTSPAGSQSYQITFTACATGMQPTLTIQPNFVQLPEGDAGYTMVNMQAQSLGCTTAADNNGDESCNASVYVSVCTSAIGCDKVDIKTRNDRNSPPAEGASYLVTCVPVTNISRETEE